MKRWKFWSNDTCPCYLINPASSVLHMFKCKAPDMIIFKKELNNNKYTWLIEQENHSKLLQMIKVELSNTEIQYLMKNYISGNQ